MAISGSASDNGIQRGSYKEENASYKPGRQPQGEALTNKGANNPDDQRYGRKRRQTNNGDQQWIRQVQRS